jgi:hypothetical protein
MATRSELAQASDEDARVQAAIQATEEEIFAEANGIDDPENDGDKSLEEMEDPVGDNPDAEGDEVDAQDEDEPEAEEEDESEGEPEVQEPPQERRDERKERFVPSGRLREESERARAAEAEARQLREELARLSGRVDEMSRLRAPQEQPKAPERPDMFADPTGWEKATREEMRQTLQREMDERFLNASMATAHEDYGPEFEFAYQELLKGKNDPLVRQEAQRIMGSPNPGRALMKWAEPRLETYREERTRGLMDQMTETLGVDPEDLNRALAMVAKGRGRGSPQSNGQRQQRQQILPDLSNAGGGRGQPRIDPRGFDGSEGAIFADAFTPLR